MADPVFDENVIIAMLRNPPGPQQTVPILQQAVMMALMDMYDRKVDRQVFAKHATTCMTTYAMLSRTWMLASMSDIYNEGDLTPATFEHAHTEIVKLVSANVEQIISLVKQMQECPSSEDKVH